MKLFIDIFSGDEVLSDAMDIKHEYNDSVMTIISKEINPDDVGKVDIGNCNEFGGGDEDDGPADDTPKVNNMVANFNLEEYFGSKKDIMSLFKERITEMKAKLKDEPERLKNWEKGGAIETLVKKVFSNFDDCKFYMGQNYGDSTNPQEGMFIIAMWVDDSHTGETFHYFKDCYRITKV